MLRRVLIVCLCLIAVAGAGSSSGAQPGGPAAELQGAVAGATDVKFPHLAAAGAEVHLAANAERSDARHWAKLDTAAAFGAPARLGPAEGQPDYATASVALAPDGALYYAWVNQPARAIYLRVRAPGGAWGPARVVASGQPFPVHPEVAVAGDRAVTVVWRNPDQPFVYRRSPDGGQSWGRIAALSEGAGVGVAALAAGPDGRLAAAYTGGEGDRLQVYLAVWDGGAFAPRRLTALGGDYADPSLTYTPDGRLLVAWRGVAETGPGAGVFYAEGMADGSFPPARLAGGRVAGRVSLSADAAGNLHMLWTAASGDGYQLWYAVKPAGAPWSQPVAAAGAGGQIFNAYGVGAVGTGGAVYAHAASEVFLGSKVSLRHYRFRAGLTGAPAVGARPLLEQGAPRTRAAQLAVAFADVVGAPAEVRLRWGGPPTDADPWQPFAPALSLPAPAPADPEGCAEATLFTQVRAGGALQAAPLSATITLDTAVQARAWAYHPGAAPGYTDEPALGVAVAELGECSGLASVRELAEGALPVGPGAPGSVALTIGLPDAEGRYERAVELADGLGNTRVVSVGVVYDRSDPAASYPEPLVVIADPQATIFQRVRVAGAAYSDGDGAPPWAVAVAVGRAPVDPAGRDAWAVVPLDAGALAWAAGDGAQGGTASAEATISLAALLPRAALTPGRYYYGLALLDRAGNPTASVATGQLELAEVTYPRVYLPALLRGGA